MEQSKNLSMCFKVNNDVLKLELLSSEEELYNKLMNDDTYSVQYIKLLIKNGFFILNGKNEIQEIFRVIGNEEQLIFHTNIYSGQLSDNKENETEPMCEYNQNESQPSQEHNKKEKRESTDYWNDSTTAFLLDKYETYMSNIGPMKKFKTKKSMWAQIAIDMMTMLDVSKTPLQVENRYKTILKRKKKAVENNSRSGSSREDVPYEKELSKIANLDDSIEPEVLRSARSVKYPKLNTKMSEEVRNDDDVPTHSNIDSSPKRKKSCIDKRMEYFEKKEAAKERRHQEKLNLIRELFAKQQDEN